MNVLRSAANQVKKVTILLPQSLPMAALRDLHCPGATAGCLHCNLHTTTVIGHTKQKPADIS